MIKHGFWKTRTWRAWADMKARCSSPTGYRKKYYVDRGIKVCKHWMNFENFLLDMGVCPDGKTLDRKDNNKGYEPGNCRWASKDEQYSNRSSNIFYERNGKRKTLTQWAKMFGIKPMVFYQRLVVLKWSFEEAICTPIRKKAANSNKQACHIP